MELSGLAAGIAAIAEAAAPTGGGVEPLGAADLVTVSLTHPEGADHVGALRVVEPRAAPWCMTVER